MYLILELFIPNLFESFQAISLFSKFIDSNFIIIVSFILKTPQKLDFWCLTLGGAVQSLTDVFLYAYFDLM